MNQHRFLLLHDISPSRPQSYTLNSKVGSVSLTLAQRVTNNHPILTGKIVLAHLKEMLDYYARLEVAELEGDLLKAARAGDLEKLAQKYQQLLVARAELSVHERASGVKAD